MDLRTSLLIEFGETLKTARKSQKLSQQQLGDKIGVSKSYIYKIEKGKKNIELITQLRLLKALNLGAEVLITKALIDRVDLDELGIYFNE